jgi:hypothetical protein
VYGNLKAFPLFSDFTHLHIPQGRIMVMALDHSILFPWIGILIFWCAWIDAQAFSAEEDGTVLTVDYPVATATTTTSFRGKINPCITVPVPLSCLATKVTTIDSDWTFPAYKAPTTQPTPLPLAPGTRDDCASYTEYLTPPRKTSTLNSCYVVATFFDGTVIIAQLTLTWT